MTESELAIQASINFQAKKDSFKQVQNGDVKITLTIAANELPVEFMQAEMGQIYTVVMVATDTDEQPIKIESKNTVKIANGKVNGNIAQAAILCMDDKYWQFLSHTYEIAKNGVFDNEYAATCMRAILLLESRSEVSSGEPAKRFKRHVYLYNEWRKGEFATLNKV